MMALSTSLNPQFGRGQSAYTCDEGKPFTAEKVQHSLNETHDKNQPDMQFGGMLARDSGGRTYSEWHIVGVKVSPRQAPNADHAGFHLSTDDLPRIHSMASISDCHTGKNITIFPDLKTARIGYNVGATSWKRKDGASLFEFLTSGPRPPNAIFEDLGFKEIEGLVTHGYRTTVLGTEDDGEWNGAVMNITEWWVSDDLAVACRGTDRASFCLARSFQRASYGEALRCVGARAARAARSRCAAKLAANGLCHP